MIRLTLFFLFAALAVLSVILVFFTKNHAKTALFCFSAFLFTSLVCVIFRNSLPALAILFSGAACSATYYFASTVLKEQIVPAGGATPKFLKFFSALCCIGLFFSIIIASSELKENQGDIAFNKAEPASQEKTPSENKNNGLSFYMAGLASLAFLSVFPGRNILVYDEVDLK